MKQVTPNVRVLETNYRFSATNLLTYAKFINEALAAENKVIIFADKKARDKISQIFPKVIKPEIVDKLVVRPYPGNRLSAVNVMRGMSSTAAIFIDEYGRYTDELVQGMSGVNTQNALIVHHQEIKTCAD